MALGSGCWQAWSPPALDVDAADDSVEFKDNSEQGEGADSRPAPLRCAQRGSTGGRTPAAPSRPPRGPGHPQTRCALRRHVQKCSSYLLSGYRQAIGCRLEGRSSKRIDGPDLAASCSTEASFSKRGVLRRTQWRKKGQAHSAETVLARRGRWECSAAPWVPF